MPSRKSSRKAHAPNVLVRVEQEAAEDVDGQHTQAALCPNLHDGARALVQNRVAHVLGRFRVGRDLCAGEEGKTGGEQI